MEGERGSLVPLDHLLIIVLVITTPSIREEETSKGVSSEIGTMRVHLASRIIGSEVDEGLVDKTDDLDVVGGPHELNALESATGDEASSMTGLGAPRDSFVFSLANGGRTIWWTPDAEI